VQLIGECRGTKTEAQSTNQTKMTRKKICITTPEFPPAQWGGLARTVGKVARHAANMGLEVHVAHLEIAENGFVPLDENRRSRSIEGITVHQLTVGREKIAEPLRSLWDCPHTLTLQMIYQSLEMLHRKERFNLFHSFFLWPTGYVTGMLARRFGVPSVLTVVGNDIKKYIFSPEKVGACRSGLENADRVVALSRDLVEMAHALTPIEDKARIIYNSVDLPDQVWSRERSGNEPFRIGCAGIFKYAKGLPYIFKAVARLKMQHRLAFVLLGELRESERDVYHQMLDRTGIEDILSFTKAIPHDAVPEWLRSLDVFVLPSVTEGCPNILMEAMASGVPTIATRTGAMEALVEDCVTGLLVPWGDSGALADALAEIIANPRLAKSLGTAGREKMKELSFLRERDAWESLYRELIEL
jgi:glycosyltransferase involved in cell wall biosynthesis